MSRVLDESDKLYPLFIVGVIGIQKLVNRKSLLNLHTESRIFSLLD